MWWKMRKRQVEMDDQKHQGNQLEYLPQLLYLRHHLQKAYHHQLGIQYLQKEVFTLSEQKTNIHGQKALDLNLLMNALKEVEEKKRRTPDHLYLRPVISRTPGHRVFILKEVTYGNNVWKSWRSWSE